jgi:hypothetical protein
MWFGYSLSVKCFNDGFFVNIDTSTKFVTSTTVYDKIKSLERDLYSRQEIKEKLIPKDPEKKRLVVITPFNSKTYQIDDLSFEITPKNYKFTWKFFDP